MINIGVFDSGVGGLSVLRELIKNNNANYFYLGDTKRVPYGGRSKDEILKFSDDIVSFLEKYDIDEYVIACNTMSVIAADYLRDKYKKKFYSITDAGINEARSYSGDFLILATKATIESHYYRNEIEKNNNAKVYEVIANNLVSQIESGTLGGAALDNNLREYLKIANDKKIENIILGCTHYPIIKSSIIKNLDYKANIIDPAVGITKLIKKQNNVENNILITMTERSSDTEIIIDKLINKKYKLKYEELK